MTVDATTRELVHDCLSRLASADSSAAFDLASVFMSHADEKDIGINLAVIEALVMSAKMHGSAEAADFLSSQWSDIQTILRKRWRRAGFTG